MTWTTRRPIVGITATVRTLELPFATTTAQTVLDAFVDRIAAAGGIPVVVPVVGAGLAPPLVDALDALVLTGGDDLGVDPERDRHEIALVRAAGAAGVPVLGVCRGLQVINVALGGTLTPHVDGHLGAEVRHRVWLAPEGALGAALGPAVHTGSLHHQAVERLGAGLRVTGLAQDGTVEAVESVDRLLVGVQWHPELEDGPAGDALWRWFVRRAAAGGAEVAA